MSTILEPSLDEIRCDQGLSDLLRVAEEEPLLFQESWLRERLLLLDELDVVPGASGSALSEIQRRALVLQERLESANAELFQSIRERIACGETRAVLPWLEELAPKEESTGARPGLGFDVRDDFMASIFQQREPRGVSSTREREMIAYQPTPVRHVLRLLKLAGSSREDVFVDLGAGMGHVPLLVSMLTGARSVGIEIEAAYVASAGECARGLRLGGVSFVAADAREADLSTGTVFYLYSPFTGSILDQVMGSLRRQSLDRSIRVCSLGPCTHNLERERWLKASGPVDVNHITFFESC